MSEEEKEAKRKYGIDRYKKCIRMIKKTLKNVEVNKKEFHTSISDKYKHTDFRFFYWLQKW